MMCVFTVVMTYSITCPIIVPFGRHRRAGTWALLGGTQDLTDSTLVRQATPSGQGPGWETSPLGLPPGPWLILGPGLRGGGEKPSQLRLDPAGMLDPWAKSRHLGCTHPHKYFLSSGYYWDIHHIPTECSHTHTRFHTGSMSILVHSPIHSGKTFGLQGGLGSLPLLGMPCYS